ncbi:MAG: ABC transporter permease [Christensenellales bacterium]|jgi:putative ABC transport system permease protein
MRLTDLLAMSLQSLWRRRLRTVLTVLGVVIGTAAIIIMVSLGVGINQGYVEELESLGSLRRIDVYGGGYYGMPGGGSSENALTDDTVRQFSAMAHVSDAVGYYNIWGITIKAGKYQYGGSILAIDPENLPKLGIEIQEGTTLSPGANFDMLLGSWAKQNFYDPTSYVWTWNENGPDIDWLNTRYNILAGDSYMAENPDQFPDLPAPKRYKGSIKGLITPSNSEYDSYLIMSIESLRKMEKDNRKIFAYQGIDLTQYSQMAVFVDDIGNVLSVQDELRQMGYQTFAMAEIIDSMQEQSRGLQTLLGAIGAVSLLVAALGITNTMLMSIYERTREIGVMKVLGCRVGNIGAMFLFEAGMIGLIGGLLGIVFSFGVSTLINYLISGGTGELSMMRSVIPAWLMLVSLIFSVLVGVMAGYYPARRATKLSPLAAIRNA